MARILYLHGSNAGIYGPQPEHLERHGYQVVGRPRLPYPRHRRLSWKWVFAYLDQQWLPRAVAVAQECYDSCRADVVVGASMGGVVAMNLATGDDTAQVLLAPPWRAWGVLRFGPIHRLKPATVLIHGERDRTVFARYSRLLLTSCRPDAGTGETVKEVERRLGERVGQDEPGLYVVEGRLVVVRGEGHRCNSESALAALLAAVEVLDGRAHWGR